MDQCVTGFSLAEVLIFLGGTITAMGIPTGVLFRALLKNQGAENAFLKLLVNRTLRVTEGTTELGKEALKTTTRSRRQSAS